MTSYLFHIELPPFTEEMNDIVPIHREHIDKLIAEGHMQSYSVSMQRNMIWCVVNTETMQEAMEMVAAFPLHKFFTDVICHPLLIHNTSPASLPDISLN